MNLLNLFSKSQEFKAKLEASRQRLFRVAYSWSHESSLADDLVQETLEKALKKSDQLREPAAMHPWLLSILTNCWRDHFRRTKNMVDLDEATFICEFTPEDEQSRHQIVSEVRRAIAELPIGQRQVVTLVDLEECSYIEVADILDVPIGTVMSRLCRARRALKNKLIENGSVQADHPAYIRSVN